MSDRFADRAAVADKIEWEGGIMEALDYGLRTTDMPEGDDELTEAWGKLAAAYRELTPLVDAVGKLLNGARSESVAGDDL
jgi:hypothetical protein